MLLEGPEASTQRTLAIDPTLNRGGRDERRELSEMDASQVKIQGVL